MFNSVRSGHYQLFPIILLGSTFIPSCATLAQTASPSIESKTSADHKKPASRTSSSSKAKESYTAKGKEAVTVQGGRIVAHGANNAVTRQVMDRFIQGTNPMQILAATTPGAYFASSDAFGLDTPSNTLFLRGFNQTQIGATLDGMPLGEQSVMNILGIAITQAVIQDDVAGMTVSQGAGALDAFSTQALGGAISYVTANPKDQAGGKVNQTFGSYAAFRTYARVDSGILNSTGTKFYASFARTDSNLWKGQGYQNELQADTKLVQPVGEIGKITAFFSYGNFTQGNYLSLTKNMWKKMGRNTTYLKPDYEKAKLWSYYSQYTNTVPPGYAGVLSNDEIGDYAWDGSQIQRTYIASVNGHFDLTNHITSDTVAFSNVMSARYGGTNNSVTSPSGGPVSLNPDGTVSGVPMALAMASSNGRRIGFTQKFGIEAPYGNHITFGTWYENNRYIYDSRLYEDGINKAHNWLSDFKSSQAHTWFNDAFNTNTFQFFLQDHWTIKPGMTLLGGFKSMIQTTHGGTKNDYTQHLIADGWNAYYRHAANGSLTASNAFLPHFAFDWHFSTNHEIYWDIAENMRAYDYAYQSFGGQAWGGLGNATPGQTAQNVFDANKSRLKPERTWNYVVGYRYEQKYVSASVDFYHTDYYNRLAAITEGSANTAHGAFLNVGRETMNGADAQAAIRPLENLEITNSFSWNDAEYLTRSINYSGKNYSLHGKHQTYYPKFMYKANLNYRYNNATFNFNVNYLGSRPMTYLNDQKIPPYWLANMSMSYDFGAVSLTKNLRATFAITNLFNANYIGGVFGAASVSGDNNANLYVGSPREFYGSISAEF